MQTRFFRNLAAGLALLATVAACQKRTIVHGPTTTSRAPAKVYGPSSGQHLPPGQAKKLYGHQSARAFAPGQQKKNNGPVVVVKGDHKKDKKKGGKKK